MDTQILVKQNLSSNLALNMHKIWSCRFKFIITNNALYAWLGLELDRYCLLLMPFGYLYSMDPHFLIPIGYKCLTIVGSLILDRSLYCTRTYIPKWNHQSIGMVQNVTDPNYNSNIERISHLDIPIKYQCLIGIIQREVFNATVDIDYWYPCIHLHTSPTLIWPCCVPNMI